MKKISFIATLIIFSATCFCQQIPASTSLTRAEYLKKSKRQKTVGFILLSSGVAFATFAIVQGIAKSDIGIFTLGTLLGGGMIIASVPVFNAAARNKTKAENASVSFIFEQNHSLNQSRLNSNSFPAISLKLHL